MANFYKKLDNIRKNYEHTQIGEMREDVNQVLEEYLEEMSKNIGTGYREEFKIDLMKDMIAFLSIETFILRNWQDKHFG